MITQQNYKEINNKSQQTNNRMIQKWISINKQIQIKIIQTLIIKSMTISMI